MEIWEPSDPPCPFEKLHAWLEKAPRLGPSRVKEFQQEIAIRFQFPHPDFDPHLEPVGQAWKVNLFVHAFCRGHYGIAAWLLDRWGGQIWAERCGCQWSSSTPLVECLRFLIPQCLYALNPESEALKSVVSIFVALLRSSPRSCNMVLRRESREAVTPLYELMRLQGVPGQRNQAVYDENSGPESISYYQDPQHWERNLVFQVGVELIRQGGKIFPTPRFLSYRETSWNNKMKTYAREFLSVFLPDPLVSIICGYALNAFGDLFRHSPGDGSMTLGSVWEDSERSSPRAKMFRRNFLEACLQKLEIADFPLSGQPQPPTSTVQKTTRKRDYLKPKGKRKLMQRT